MGSVMMPRGTPIAPEDLQKMIDLKKKGRLNENIAQVFGVGLRSVERHTAHVGPRSPMIALPRSSLHWSVEKAKIHGYLCADGNEEESSGYKVLRFTNSCKLLLNCFKKCVERVYGIKPSQSRDNALRICHAIVVRDLLRYSPYTSHEWTVPRELFYEGKGVRAAWVQAFFDGDAYFEMTWSRRGSWKRRITVTSVNERGLASVVKLLGTLGIESRVRGPHSDGLYRLVISRKENMEKFAATVNSLHPKKRRKLVRMLDSYIR